MTDIVFSKEDLFDGVISTEKYCNSSGRSDYDPDSNSRFYCFKAKPSVSKGDALLFCKKKFPDAVVSKINVIRRSGKAKSFRGRSFVKSDFKMFLIQFDRGLSS